MSKTEVNSIDENRIKLFNCDLREKSFLGIRLVDFIKQTLLTRTPVGLASNIQRCLSVA